MVTLVLHLALILLSDRLRSQVCSGGAVMTHENYLFGRFETRMQSAAGDGIVSSFFLYNTDVDCNWPWVNSEIDIEMTGNDPTVQFTVHFPPLPGAEDPWSITDDEEYGFDPHSEMHDYAIEWEPDVVRWFIDGNLAHQLTGPYMDELIHPMRIHMNLWAADAPDWVGEWDPAVLPAVSRYEYVRCYAYTPGNGSHGTADAYSLLWEDAFDALDSDRWDVSEFTGFDGNYCLFESSSVEVVDGALELHIADYEPSLELIPVTFAVDVTTLDMGPGDVIYLNGEFNDWCGNCEPMEPDGNIWSTTRLLSPGRYQYLFAKNLWEEIGSAPQGSSCDFEPCDEWLNYGFILSHGIESLELDTICWTTCDDCGTPTHIQDHQLWEVRNIIRITDETGRQKSTIGNGMNIIYWSDGRIVKRVVLE